MNERYKRRSRAVAVHIVRVVIFVVILAMVHFGHRRATRTADLATESTIQPSDVVGWFPNATQVRGDAGGVQLATVLDKDDDPLGYVIQTSPQGDRFIGFSGPTNVLIGFDTEDRVIGLRILSSGDTREHVREVKQDAQFWNSWREKTWSDIANGETVDAVSGATLTSIAINEAISFRISGKRPSLRFADEVSPEVVREVIPETATLKPSASSPSMLLALNASGEKVGSVLRSSPYGDFVMGRDGPTEVWLIQDVDSKIIGMRMGFSYENEPYIDWVRDEDYFLSIFNGKTLQELSELDLEQEGIEGVSGATMTSIAMAETAQAAALGFLSEPKGDAIEPTRTWRIKYSDFGTILVVALGLVIGLTQLRSRKRVRVIFQLILIVYLGLINGDLISQAMLAGWAKHGIPWSSALGLASLAAASFIVPIFSKTNIYCSHLCPHGALQQIVKKRVPWQWKLNQWTRRILSWVPFLLLAWCVAVAAGQWSFSLVDIEPFDAWVFRVAGMASISIAIIGLVFSLFVPMGYCRFGCPTGALLKFLRFHRGSEKWQTADWGAVLLLLIGGVLLFW